MPEVPLPQGSKVLFYFCLELFQVVKSRYKGIDNVFLEVCVCTNPEEREFIAAKSKVSL